MIGTKWIWLLAGTFCITACGLEGPEDGDEGGDFEPVEIPIGAPSEGGEGSVAQPIVGGSEATDHPEAALLNMVTAGGQNAVCSGAVIAPHVVLTAGHCISGVISWEVIAPYAGGQTATSFSGLVHDYTDTSNQVNPNQHDVGLVVLDTAIQLDSYPTLASEPVAFGSEIVNVGRIDNGTTSFDSLFVSPTVAVYDGSEVGHPFAYRSDQVIQPGDSGGPDLLPGTHTIVAVNSGAGQDVQILARVDLVHDWIQDQIAAIDGEGAPPPEGPPAENPPTDDPTEDCGGIGPQGACVGSVMTYCTNGSFLEIDCASWDLSCDDASGSPQCQ